MIVRFLNGVVNTPAGAVRDLPRSRALHLIDNGVAERVDSKPEPTAPPADIPEPTSREIREWAAGYGIKCPARGPIPAELKAAYIEQHYGTPEGR